MALSSSPNILDQYRLSGSHHVADGEIIESGEDYERADAGQDMYSWWGKVRFVSDSGDEVTTYISNTTPASARPPTGRVKVRYLPDNPEVVWIEAVYDSDGWKESKWPRSTSEFWLRNRLRVIGLLAVAVAVLITGTWRCVVGIRRIQQGLPAQTDSN